MRLFKTSAVVLAVCLVPMLAIAQDQAATTNVQAPAVLSQVKEHIEVQLVAPVSAAATQTDGKNQLAQDEQQPAVVQNAASADTVVDNTNTCPPPDALTGTLPLTQPGTLTGCPQQVGPFNQPFTLTPLSSSKPKKKGGIHWGPLIEEEFNWIAFMHLERVVMEQKTRAQLNGPFFADWDYILHHINLSTWSDGGRWTTNNVYHSMDGGIASFIYRHNDDNTKYLEFDLSNPEYRKGIFKAWAVAAVSSTEFEIGPVSEATIGHVGLHADAHGMNGTGWTDFIITPFGGAAVMVGEDAVDKYVTKRFENHVQNRFAINTVRILTNPCRSMANAMEFHKPWHRETRK